MDRQDSIARSVSPVPPAHYTIKIESFSLLAGKEVEKYESGKFEAGGYKWKLVLYPKGNKSENVKGHLSLYLAMTDTTSLSFGWEVYALIRLFLLDQKKDNFLIVQDATVKERRFHAWKLEWGFDKFIPLKTFKDASKGYVVNDTCVLGAEVFVKERKTSKGECLSMIQNPSSFKYIWKIENFSKLDAERHESEVFSAGDHKWKIRLYPKGDIGATRSHLSLFLILANSLSNVKIYAEYTLRILDQVKAKHMSFKEKAWFHTDGSGWSGSKFVELDYLNQPSNGFLVEDVFVVEAEVTALGISKLL